MNAYRKRFIQLNMILIGGMLLLMLTAVGIYMAVDYYKELRNSMKQIVRSYDTDSSYSQQQPQREPPKQESPKFPENRNQRLKLKDRKEITSIRYTAESQHISILSLAAEIDESLLAAVLDKIVNRKKNYGILPHDGIIYYRTGNGDPYRIAIAPIGYIGESMYRLAGILLFIWVVAMLGFFVLSYYLSKLAVKPMEDAIAREKQFIADASHDLKTPLSIILANNSILRKSGDSCIAAQMKWIDSTETAAKNMQQLIQEMLTLSALEQRTSDTAAEAVNISAIVTKAALQMESVAYEKDITLDSDIADGLIMTGDEECLRRISASLIENAIKYEPSGGRVSITLARRKRQLRLTVRNHNSVIPDEDLPHVFERFYRGDKSRRTHDSHGLGLAITKQMAENMGGKILAESKKQTGTAFTVLFPLH